MDSLDPTPRKRRAPRPRQSQNDAEALVTASFARVAPRADELAGRFYAILFAAHPAIHALFPVEMADQQQKLVATLAFAVEHLRRPEVLTPKLVELGRRHAGYGVHDAHFDAVGEALIAALREVDAPDFTPATEAAWTTIYSRVATAMRAGHAPQHAPEETPMAVSNGSQVPSAGNGHSKPARARAAEAHVVDEAQAAEIAQLRAQLASAQQLASAVEHAAIPMMICDRNFTITFVNAASVRMLTAIEAYLPVPVAQVVGSSFDIFHKSAAQPRRMMADPRNLPHTAKIQIGPESIELRISATYDATGEYAGPALCWESVTERVQLADRDRMMMSQVEGVVGKLGASAVTLTEVSSLLASGATQTSAQATRVAAVASQIKGNVSSVASAAEEMSSTVREIASNASESAKTARQARELAAGTNQTVQALSASSAAIGKVTKVISTIAQQTNLLALNATIEAARAGEAGKGFAVVANEVKELAKETARATEEIAQQIDNIQVATGKSVTAIAEVAKVIEQIDQFATSIAASVEEQSATVREIARNASEVSHGVGNVADNIEGVAQAAKDAERHAALTQTTSSAVSEASAALAAMVRR